MIRRTDPNLPSFFDFIESFDYIGRVESTVTSFPIDNEKIRFSSFGLFHAAFWNISFHPQFFFITMYDSTINAMKNY